VASSGDPAKRHTGGYHPGMTTPQELHVVFGAGQVGPPLARLLVAAGHRVRLVRRSAAPVDVPGAELVRADARDAEAASEAARGATTVYHCVNVPYFLSTWEAELPPILDGLIAAARRHQARLVVLDNLYALGKPGGQKLTEVTPFNPCSRKGELRARLHHQLEAVVKRGDLRAVTGRASDFYGPGGVGTHFADRFWPAALNGKAAAMIIPLETPHTYHFIPDVAAGLASLGQDREAAGTFMLPCHPAEPTRALVEHLAGALGQPITTSRMSPLLLKGLGLFMPILRELGEMAYQWEAPFEVDDTRFRARYGAIAASRQEAARQTVAWGRARFGGAAKT
jgi:nucleoside-diphosphate-sugar epimerase